MSEAPVNIHRAKQLYLLSNLVNLGLYTFIIFRFLNIADLRSITSGIDTQLLLVFILINWFLRSQAKKIGNGLKNPIHTIKTAKILVHLTTAFFFLGLIIAFTYSQAIYLTTLCLPLQVAAIILTIKDLNQEETDVIDDFTIEDH